MENYEKVRKLGKGSFGAVTLVKSKSTNKYYALKKIDGSLIQNSSHSAKNEIKLMQSLNHPNIIKFYDSFERNGDICLLMEYAENGDLSQKVYEAKLNNTYIEEKQILIWLTQICLALKSLHENKIIHRDIKISNVFLNKDGLIKVGDFGISKQLTSDAEFAKTSVGTPYYLPPEMIDKQKYKHYNHMVDIWMLGCAVYELCTFQKPFFPQEGDWEELFRKIFFENPNPIPECYSPFLQKLISQMLNKIPDNRITINEILGSEEIQATLKVLMENKIFQNYYKKNSPILPARNSITAVIKKRKSSFGTLQKNISFITSSEDSIKYTHKLTIDRKSKDFPLPKQKENEKRKPLFQKNISINTNGFDNPCPNKKESFSEIDESKNNDNNSIPTDKVKPKRFAFELLQQRKTPNFSNRSILSSKFLIMKLGKEKFEKALSFIECGPDPLKTLEENRGAILEMIGEKNQECLEIYKYIINNEITPSNSLQTAMKSERILSFFPSENNK